MDSNMLAVFPPFIPHFSFSCYPLSPSPFLSFPPLPIAWFWLTKKAFRCWERMEWIWGLRKILGKYGTWPAYSFAGHWPTKNTSWLFLYLALPMRSCLGGWLRKRWVHFTHAHTKIKYPFVFLLSTITLWPHPCPHPPISFGRTATPTQLHPVWDWLLHPWQISTCRSSILYHARSA